MNTYTKTGIALLAFSVVCAAAWSLLSAKSARETKQRAFPGDSRALLEDADTFEMLSLSPDGNPEAILPKTPNTSGHFHGWRILGRTPVRAPQQRKQLLAALYNSMGGSCGAMCFNPRHGIHASKNGKTVDLIICFGCGRLQTNTPQGVGYSDICGGENAKSAFNAVLQNSNVPLTE